MNSETTFTCSSGNRCQFEMFVENGKASVNVVWIGKKPTEDDIDEFARFMEGEAARANFAHTGIENVMLGKIQREDLPRLREVVAERLREQGEE
jgi:hypothetical protein